MATAPIRLLLIDDDKDVIVLVHQMLSAMQGWNFKPEWVNNYQRGQQVMAERRHDVYLVDVRLPDGNGIDLVRRETAGGNVAPMIIVTSTGDNAVVREGLQAGAMDVLDKTEVTAPLLERVIGYALERADRLRSLTRMDRSLRGDDGNTILDLARLEQKRLEHRLSQVLELLARTIEIRGPYSPGHQQRIAQLASAIAARMGLERRQADNIYLAGLVHDIGNIHLPADILSLPAPLTRAQFNVVREHSRLGYEFLKDMNFDSSVALSVKQHHERINGSGYPERLRGAGIILEARILAVADVVGAMTLERPYRKALPLHAALSELTRRKGSLYDPDVVDACIAVCRDGYRVP